MIEMREVLKKKISKRGGGFTLAELLVVVAILAILVAVSIPIFSGKLNEARKNTDLANMRAAKAAAVTEFLQSEQTTNTNFVRLYDAENGKVVATGTKLSGYNKADQGTDGAVKAGEGVVQVTIEMKTSGAGSNLTTEADAVKAVWVNAPK